METMTETKSKEVITRFSFSDKPKAFENLLSMMLPCYLGSDVFLDSEPVIRNHQAHFLLDLRELFNNTLEGIIKKFPDFADLHDDFEFNRNTLIQCYSHYVFDENLGGPAIGFKDMQEESFGALELIDLFKRE